jgi:hypothetical protein
MTSSEPFRSRPIINFDDNSIDLERKIVARLLKPFVKPVDAVERIGPLGRLTILETPFTYLSPDFPLRLKLDAIGIENIIDDDFYRPAAGDPRVQSMEESCGSVPWIRKRLKVFEKALLIDPLESFSAQIRFPTNR